MNSIRYEVEHRAFPTILFGRKEFPQFLLDRGGEGIVALYEMACQVTGVKANCPYRAEEFRFDLHAMAGNATDDRMFLAITMPKAELPPECERVFVCWHRDSDAVGYFTVEKSFGGCMLCSWDEEGTHSNFGSAPKTEDEQLQRVMELFD